MGNLERQIPEKLKFGDTIRVVAPSWSLKLVDPGIVSLAEKRLDEMGLKVTYGRHVNELDHFNSSPPESRLSDIHEAFEDDSVKGVMTVLGGWSVNQLFDRLDWGLIKSHPKVFCGFSDIDSLNNAIYSQTGLVTYSGPHFIFFGQKHHTEYTKKFFSKALFESDSFSVEPSQMWSDDEWFINQDDRTLLANPGWRVLRPGEAEGEMIVSNLTALTVLNGTRYAPDLNGVVLFLEEAKFANAMTFNRKLQSLVQQPGFKPKALVVGRFQKGMMSEEDLNYIISSKPELNKIPVLAGVDFGHTDPKLTLPVGGSARIAAVPNQSVIEVVKH